MAKDDKKQKPPADTGNFAQRYGYEPIDMPFQRERVDEDLRTKLWNILSLVIWNRWQPAIEFATRSRESMPIEQLVRRLWVNYFNRDLDQLPRFKTSNSRGAYDVL